MNAAKLHISMIGTLAAIIGLSTLFLTIILSLFDALSLTTLLLAIVSLNVIQWLIAPYLIDMMYRVRKVSRTEEPELYNMIDRISQKSRMKTPELVIARIPIPNAFAYGSPLTGNRIAVTSGLLNTLDAEEVEAVIGHELGHLKNRDVQVMMFVSILPAIFYYIGYSMMWSSMYSRRNEREQGSALAIIGFLSIMLYWVLTFFSLYLSRLREYYADRHSATTVDDGARKLSEGLVKITEWTERTRRQYPATYNMSSLKTLFISDPDNAGRDLREVYHTKIWRSDQDLVTKYLNRKVTAAEQFAELFSTHPNLVKRLRALQELQ
ncbi:MAG: zinc metalloprotease HtpX [Candidatus Bathyarchaeia archaeon]|nr:M48 family metalloprotease [Candidatus Bathyarchaeota archaeon]